MKKVEKRELERARWERKKKKKKKKKMKKKTNISQCGEEKTGTKDEDETRWVWREMK
jgi:hypothetical protein